MFQEPRNPEVSVPANCQVASGSGSDRFPCLPVCPAVFKRYFFFLPFSLFHKVIARLSSFKGKGILFAPSFPEAPGFPYLLRRSKGHARLPSSMSLSQVTSRLFGLLRGSNIPNWKVWFLFLWSTTCLHLAGDYFDYWVTLVERDYRKVWIYKCA